MRGEDGLDTALREALRRSEGSAADPCPDEETLAALVEGALGRRERRRLDEHFAACERCRETLVHLRNVQDAAEEERRVSPFRSWRPMIAALATASLGVVLAIRLFPESGAPPETSLRDEARPRAEARHRAPPAAVGRAGSEAPQAAGAKTEGSFASSPGERTRRPRPTAGVPAEPAPEPRAERPASPPEERAMQPSIRAKPSLDEAPAPAAKKSLPAAPASRERSDRADRGALAADTDRARTSPSRRAPAEAETAAAGHGATTSFESSTASALPLWRIGPGGAIEHRSPAGGWQAVEIEDAPTISAVAGVSERAAWAVAPRGVVLRTIDGDTWSPVTAPTDEDLVAVSASTPDRAVVTTKTGSRFATEDGGRTWTKR